MDMDEDDDIYAPEEPTPQVQDEDAKDPPKAAPDLEEGEEEDESGAMDEDSDSDSDIDIITERKDGTKAAPPPQAKYSDIRNIPQRTTSSDDTTVKAAPVKKEGSAAPSAPNVAAPSSDEAAKAASKSTVDIYADPIHPGSGKPISQVIMDEDLPENDKPWRNPGTDISDYFNYGFDEFTWALYAAKQNEVRGSYSNDAMSGNKMMEDLGQMMMGGMGMPGGGGNVGGGGAGGMPGMDGMPPEMQQMMQQMMASGMDPSQMDPSQMNAMFSGMQNQGGGGPQGGQGQNFGGGFGGNQGGFGYDQHQNMAGGGGGGGRGGFGRGRRGRW